MPSGRPPKSAAQKKAAGTHRKDRRTAADAPPPPPAMDKSPPPGLSEKLAAEWGRLIKDLEAVGVVAASDLDRLATAYECRKNAEEIQVIYNAALEARDVVSVGKLQSSHASAVKTADSIIAAVERAVKLRPLKDEDEWAKILGN